MSPTTKICKIIFRILIANKVLVLVGYSITDLKELLYGSSDRVKNKMHAKLWRRGIASFWEPVGS
jgi:hypothetical protein